MQVNTKQGTHWLPATKNKMVSKITEIKQFTPSEWAKMQSARLMQVA
jgi:hypothetical protein